MFVTSVAGARRRRGVCAVVFVLTLGVYLVSSNRVAMVTIGPRGWYAGVDDGCVQIGCAEPGTMPWVRDLVGTNQTGIGVFSDRSWSAGFSSAWRPFHGRGYYGERLLVPVWPLLLGSLGLAMYFQGVVVGGRLASAGACRWCGYDLSALRKRARGGDVTCPECGRGADEPRGNSPPANAVQNTDVRAHDPVQ